MELKRRWIKDITEKEKQKQEQKTPPAQEARSSFNVKNPKNMDELETQMFVNMKNRNQKIFRESSAPTNMKIRNFDKEKKIDELRSMK